MSEQDINPNSEIGGASKSVSVPLPLVLPECECPCHKNGGEPYSCGGMCWHPQLDADENTVELASSTDNVDHYVRLLAVYSFGKLKYLVFDPSNGSAQRFEVTAYVSSTLNSGGEQA
jgi:hypothetical protein